MEARPQINNHHIWWPRRKYNSALETRLRQHAGFLIGMLAVDHTSLHKAIEPPEKPSSELLQNILRESGRPDMQLNDGTEIIRNTINYLYTEANYRGNSYAENCINIADNLVQQLGFIAINPINDIKENWGNV